MLEACSRPTRPPGEGLPGGDPLLARVLVGMQEVNLGKEQAFLALGAALEAVAARAGESSLLAQRATRALTSAEGKVAAEGLLEMASSIGQRMAGWERESSAHAEVLAQVLGTLEKAGEELTALRAVARKLNMLGTATRVQSARLREGGSAFAVLAGEIEGIAGSVAGTMSVLEDRSRRVRVAVQEVLGRLAADLARNRGRGEELIALSQGVLGTLTTLGASSGRAAEAIQERSRQVTAALEELVVAVQYEDITRQELERLTGEMSGDPCLAERGRWAARMAGVAREITGQEDRIRAQFHLLEASVAGLAEETSRGHHAGSLFLAELEKGMERVQGRLADTLETGKATAEGLSRAADSVGEMASHLAPVAELGEDIALLALNARVKAAHLAGEGAGLHVVAQAIGEVSRRAGELSASLEEDLDRVAGAAGRMSGEIQANIWSDETRLGTMARELGAILDGLRALQKMVLDQMARIQDISGALAADLRRTLDAFEAGEGSAPRLRELALLLGGADEEAARDLTPTHAGTVELF